MTSFIFHTRSPNTQENVSYVLGFYVSDEVYFFAFWGVEKHVFHIAPFRSTSYELKSFGIMWVRIRVSIWSKVKNHLRGVYTSVMPTLYTNIHIKLMFQISL